MCHAHPHTSDCYNIKQGRATTAAPGQLIKPGSLYSCTLLQPWDAGTVMRHLLAETAKGRRHSVPQPADFITPERRKVRSEVEASENQVSMRNTISHVSKSPSHDITVSCNLAPSAAHQKKKPQKYPLMSDFKCRATAADSHKNISVKRFATQ